MVCNEPRKAAHKCVYVMFWYPKKKKKKENPLPLFDKAGVKVKKRTDYTAKLDRIFSKYIRLRDSSNGVFRCISCGRILPIEKADCGHFFSRTHMATRWNEDNCHAECSWCNRMRSDHLIGYQENLIRKIGKARFDKLLWLHNTTKQYSDFEKQELIKLYKEKLKKLEREKGR